MSFYDAWAVSAQPTGAPIDPAAFDLPPTQSIDITPTDQH
jgi:hypothetical protein